MKLINHRDLYNLFSKEYKKRFYSIFDNLGIFPKERITNGIITDRYYLPEDILMEIDKFNCKSHMCKKIVETIKEYTLNFVKENNEASIDK